MTDHTKEPWSIDPCEDSEDCFDVMSDGKWFIATTHDCVNGESNAEANARRIVACVNACAGIPLDWLESGTDGCLQNVRTERDQYLRQRDEYRDTIAQQAELLAAHKAEMQDLQRAMLKAQQERDELLAAAIKVNALSIQTDAHRELRAAIASVKPTPQPSPSTS